MNLDPALGRVDRIGSVIMGAGLFAYAILGDFDRLWLRAAMVALGVVLALNGIGGT